MADKYIGDYSEGRHNNFDFLRFFFATLVMFSHSFAFLYNGDITREYDPLIRFSDGQAGFGGNSVDCFFLISGFLVTQSWERSTNWRSFALKRILRIVPGMAAVLLLTVFVLGPLVASDRTTYFQNHGVYHYLGLMWSHDINTDDRIPGVFENNPMHGVVNGSLWTIRYEMFSYVLVAVLGMMMFFRRRALILAITLLLWLMRDLHHGHIHSFGKYDVIFHLETYFFLGAVFYLYREKIVHSGMLAIAAFLGLFIAGCMHILLLVDPIFQAYLVFYIAYWDKLKLNHFAKYGDFSYGMYLWACPIQQILTQYYGSVLNAYSMFIYSFILTGISAILSWNLIEKPFLRLKPKSAKNTQAVP
jgi:peptidoglycan/LPS O-acetylase OafA/YrhL